MPTTQTSQQVQTRQQQEPSLSNRHLNDKIRLDKFVSSQRQDITRSLIKTILRQGRVTVNGVVVKKPEEKIIASRDVIKLDGEEIIYKKFIYIMLNKPKGVVCSTKDGLSPTVISLVPENLYREGLFPAGRLDKDTEGFVLLTDDGELSHKMLSPKSHVPKLYFVRLEKPVQNDYKERFRKGIVFSDGTECLPAQLFNGENENECYVVLCEGMFHQVKKMFEALSNKVVYLKRLQIGGLKLDSRLELGECMEIMHKDVEKLLEHPRIFF